MLSGIKLVPKEEAERIDAEDRKHHKKDHKKKHKKKHKRDKHDQKPASDTENSGSDRSPSPRREYRPPARSDANVSQPAPPGNQPSRQREDWMTVPMGRPLATSAPKEGKEELPSDPDHSRVSSRELNPYLKNGGDGLPQQVDKGEIDVSGQHQQPQQTLAGGLMPGIGDGGASWRMKALRRAQAQAGEEGKGLSDVVKERWGALGDLTAELAEKKAAHGMAHVHASRDRRREGRDRDGGEREEERRRGGSGDGRYLKDVKSARSQMRRPSEADLMTMSWRREPRGGSGSEGSGRGRREEVERRGAPGGGGGGGRRVREGEVEAVLKAAAPELNAFANDGSFLEQFAAAGKSKEEKQKVGDVEELGEEWQREVEREVQHHGRPPRHPHQREGGGGGGGGQTYRERGGRERAPPPQKANVFAAAALRARLGGRPCTAATAPHTKEPEAEGEETVILPMVDAQGRAAPGAFGRESSSAAAATTVGARPAKRVERYADGERKRYFADDDAVDLETLVKRTKYGSTEDIDATMARNIAKKSNFKESDLDADAEYDWDGGLDLADGSQRKVSKEARRRGNASEEIAKKEKQRQVREYSKFQNAVDRCGFCFSSTSRPRHLTLAIGTAAYLALPSRGRLVPGHCQIVPIDHVASSRVADETTWTEIRNFKKCLLQMFASQGMDCVFIETAARTAGDTRAHAVIDCVPVPQDVFAKAPMYFRKAVDDATSEWAQHASKRMIDTSSKGLRGAIPPNFPYFFVEFGLQAGFVHVIDDLEAFDRFLGRSVLVGLLQLPDEEMHRRAKRESESMQTQWAAEFRQQFDEFDWTKQL